MTQQLAVNDNVTFTIPEQTNWGASGSLNAADFAGMLAQLGSGLTVGYDGSGSYQPVAVDLNVDPGAGSSDGTDPDFIAPIMGNILGADMTAGKDANYFGGLIGHYNITGTKRTTYPSGAVLGGIGDGVTQVDGAFVAYIDGDGSQTNAGAAFKVRHNNSVSGSGFSYGLDLYDAAHDGFNAVSYVTADMRFSNQQVLIALTTAITANSTLTSAPIGSIGITSHATGRGKLFMSDGTKWQFAVVA